MMQQIFLGQVPSLNIDDVFSVDTYTGNGGTSLSINNGIDFSGEGGLVWIKARSTNTGHFLFDTERGPNRSISSNDNSNEDVTVAADGLTSFNNNGFTLGGVPPAVNYTQDYVAWSFRKAPGFLDVVTYFGNGVNGRAISHNLGETPGLIIIKALTTGTYDWMVWHPDLTNISYHDKLNVFGSQTTNPPMLTVAPSSTSFSVSNSAEVNDVGGTLQYVAYVFANNNEFVKCSSYTGNGSTGQTINVGFDPQWVLIKNLTRSEDWIICDSARTHTDGSANALMPNVDRIENTLTTVNFVSNGFSLGNYGPVNLSGDSFMYMAIAAP